MNLGKLKPLTGAELKKLTGESASGWRAWFYMTEEEYESLNPPILMPLLRSDGLYFKVLQDERWLPVGYIPRPQTRRGWFLYHLAHGLAMRYRLLPVLAYSLKEAFWEEIPR